MIEWLQLPWFGICSTIVIYFLVKPLKKRWNVFFLNPVLLSVTGIICLLKVFNIDYETYHVGGEYLTFFLGPAIVSLGAFMYEKSEVLRQDIKLLFAAVSLGGILGVLSVTLILVFLKMPDFLVTSMAAKSVTTPIAVEITKVIGGIPDITAGTVIAVGIFGNACGPLFLKCLGIRDPRAVGAALGTAAHGIGTARAIEEGHLSGVYSGIAMCLNGVITAFFTPLVFYLFL